MTANPAHSDTIQLSPGDTLDGYTIAERIGAGGTSVVWKARGDDTGQTVAIKQLLFTGSATEDDLVARRFRKEAKLLAELSQVHPRVVKVHQFIDDQRGAFLVMEYVSGRSLEDVLGESGDPVEPLKALKIIHAVANVLVAVHGKGVVHRDLKPSNLLLPEGGGVKVCDLGLAGLIAEQEALPVGSVRYMAPELFANEPATGAADIYALGMIAYEMFAGRAAFNEVFKTVLRDQRNQAMRWMKWHTNPRVHAPPLKEINPKIPPRLSDLVARMMDKDIDRRVASAQELAEAIGRHFNKNRPADATRPAPKRTAPPAAGNPVEKTAAIKKKRRWPVYVALVVLMLGAAVGGYVILDKQAREAAARERQADAVTDLIETANRQYQAGDFAAAVASLEEAQRVGPIDQDQADHVQAGLLLAGARVAMDAGDLAEAREKLEKLDRFNRPDIYSRDMIYAQIDEIDRRQSFREELAEIETLIDAGQFNEARQRLEAYRGVVLREEETRALGELGSRMSAGVNQAATAQAIDEARAMARQGQLAKAIQSLQRAQRRLGAPAIGEELEALRLRSRVADLEATASAADNAGDEAAAIAAYQKLQELSPTDAYESALNRLRARQAVTEGKRLLEQDNQAGAESAFVRALGYHDNAEARGYLARLETEADQRSLLLAADQAMAAGDYGAAVRQYGEALKLGADESARQKLTDARVKQEMARGDQALAAGDLERAKSAYRNALSLDPQTPGAEAGLEKIKTRQQYASELARGDRLRAEGKYADAKRAYKRTAEIMDTDEVQQRLDDTEYEQLLTQGKAYIELEQWSAARASLRNAATIRPTQEVKALLEQIADEEPQGDTP
jgi:tRNA A-37 threonylcarbamoyl transferase component Bud32/tetratricopeptide (TPR) repeat protein